MEEETFHFFLFNYCHNVLGRHDNFFSWMRWSNSNVESISRNKLCSNYWKTWSTCQVNHNLQQPQQILVAMYFIFIDVFFIWYICFLFWSINCSSYVTEHLTDNIQIWISRHDFEFDFVGIWILSIIIAFSNDYFEF